MALHEILGVAGSALIILMYALLQMQRVRSGTPLYLFGNLVGSSLILYSLTNHWNLSAAIIQIFFIAISIYGLFFNRDR